MPAVHLKSELELIFEPHEDCQQFKNCSDCTGNGVWCKWCSNQDKCVFFTNDHDCSLIKDCSTDSLNWLLILILILIFVALGFSIFVCGYQAIVHPASCPGQLLVRLRMSLYQMRNGPTFEQVIEQRIFRRLSSGTTDTVLN